VRQRVSVRVRVTLLVCQHLAHDRRGKDEPHGKQAKPCSQPPM
jgi:hypothetical protein